MGTGTRPKATMTNEEREKWLEECLRDGPEPGPQANRRTDKELAELGASDLMHEWCLEHAGLPKPYYEHAGITIYHADCRDILPHLPKVDLVLTDPPYGINAARIRNSQKNGWRDFEVNGWDIERAPADVIALAIVAGSHSIVWGGNYFTDVLAPTDKWLIWDKGQTDFSLADVEMAWCSWKGAARRILLPRSIALRDGKQHPTQKPLTVIKWCIRQAPDDCNLILDPFMGSGTTLVAAKQLGRRAIGIEIEEKYCAIAVKRLSQEMLPFDAPAEPDAKQTNIFEGQD